VFGPEAVAGKTGELGAVKNTMVSFGALAEENAPALGAAVAEMGPLVVTAAKACEGLGGALDLAEIGFEGVQVLGNLIDAVNGTRAAQAAMRKFLDDWRTSVSPAVQLSSRNLTNIGAAMPGLVEGLVQQTAVLAELELELELPPV